MIDAPTPDERPPRDVVRICAFAGPWPENDAPDPSGFADAVATALRIESRVSKQLETPHDLRRYSLSCATVERIVREARPEMALRSDPPPVSPRRDDPKGPVARLATWRRRKGPAAGRDTEPRDLVVDADGYIARLSAARERHEGARLGASFHPPNTLAQHRAHLSFALEDAPELRTAVLAFLDEVASRGWGIVELLARTSTSAAIATPRFTDDARGRADRPPPDASLAGELFPRRTADVCFAGDERRRTSAARLREQMIAGVASAEPVVIGSQARHDVLAEVLRELTHAQLSRDGSVRILYIDGSEAPPFPIGADLSRTPTPSGGQRLRVGLMSMRHTEVDPEVTGYWFRNRLVSTGRTLSEVEEYCVRESLRQLREVTDVGVNRIDLVHTGFEPAVVGFYRALAHWLADTSRPAVCVAPLYRSAHGYIPGTVWGVTEGSE